MSAFIPAAKESELPNPGSLLVEVDQRLIVLIRAAGHYYALDDVCTHDGGPLSDGPIDPHQATIACPRHGAKFDIKTGAAKTMPATKATTSHEVMVENGMIMVRLRSEQ
ncbi:MAG: non-heme iron oxygenase ferredoxin subunit [Pirellulales bacterium]